MDEYPRPIEAGYDGDGSPLTLGGPEVVGNLFISGGYITAVDWDGDGSWELVVGADRGYVWYFKPGHFGKARGSFEIFREPGDMSLSSEP